MNVKRLPLKNGQPFLRQLNADLALPAKAAHTGAASCRLHHLAHADPPCERGDLAGLHHLLGKATATGRLKDLLGEAAALD